MPLTWRKQKRTVEWFPVGGVGLSGVWSLSRSQCQFGPHEWSVFWGCLAHWCTISLQITLTFRSDVRIFKMRVVDVGHGPLIWLIRSLNKNTLCTQHNFVSVNWLLYLSGKFSFCQQGMSILLVTWHRPHQHRKGQTSEMFQTQKQHLFCC